MFLDVLDGLMQERGINKSVLSKESGIPYTTIDGWYKKGFNNIGLSTMRKLSGYFNVSLDYLMEQETKISNKEQQIINKFRSLDAHGKKAVTSILNVEAQRMAEIDKNAEYLPAPDGSGLIRVDDEETLQKLYSEVDQAIAEAENKDSGTGVG